MNVNKHGYLVTSSLRGEYRTYACTDLAALKHLIYRLTGREYDSYMTENDRQRQQNALSTDEYDFSNINLPGITIACQLHIYGD